MNTNKTNTLNLNDELTYLVKCLITAINDMVNTDGDTIYYFDLVKELDELNDLHKQGANLEDIITPNSNIYCHLKNYCLDNYIDTPVIKKLKLYDAYILEVSLLEFDLSLFVKLFKKSLSKLFKKEELEACGSILEEEYYTLRYLVNKINT